KAIPGFVIEVQAAVRSDPDQAAAVLIKVQHAVVADAPRIGQTVQMVNESAALLIENVDTVSRSNPKIALRILHKGRYVARVNRIRTGYIIVVKFFFGSVKLVNTLGQGADPQIARSVFKNLPNTVITDTS